MAPALAELNDGGTVRIIDFAFVRKETDGSASVVEAGDAEVADLFFHATQFDLLSEEDLIGIADGLEADSSALVIVWENRWAARLGAAVRASHGRLFPRTGFPARTSCVPSLRLTGINGAVPPRRGGAVPPRRGGAMPPRRRGRPGLMGTVARTAVVAGTATVVAGGVSRHSSQKAAEQQQAAAYQQQQAADQQQAMIDQAAAQAAAQTAAQIQAQQAAAQPIAPPAVAPEDRMAKLKELGEMKSQGLLTEEEFAAEKARILAT